MSTKPKKAEAEKWRISEISIKRLFGTHDIKPLRLGSKKGNAQNLNFLYGDNGVGKTTILNAIFALLSSEKQAGNKSYLAGLEFERIALYFENGHELIAHRPNGELSGDYELTAKTLGGDRSIFLSEDPDHRVRSKNNPGIDEFIDFVSENFPETVFVNDHRTLRSSTVSVSPRQYPRYFGHEYEETHLSREAAYELAQKGDLEKLSKIALNRMVTLAHTYITERALKSSARANQSAGNIYLRIARLIADTNEASSAERHSKAELLRSINSLLPTLAHHRQFGFEEGEGLEGILKLLDQASGKSANQIVELIYPFVESVEKRVQQSADIVGLMSIYQDTINSFFSGKSLTFRVGEPIYIRDVNGRRILPSTLSSGERHILNLFTVALLCNQTRSIILIDEPELSLNYKWQAKLSEALSSIAGPSSQFLMATHSFEIISQYRDNIRLVEKA